MNRLSFNIKFSSFLAIYKKIYNGTDHPNVLSTLYQIACQKGKIGQAQTSLEELQIILGEFFNNFLIVCNFLLTEKRLKLYSSGSHPKVLETQFSIGIQLSSMSRFDDALIIFESVLGINFFTLPSNLVFTFSGNQIKIYHTENHPLIANTLFEIAQIWGNLNHTEQSQIYHKRAHDIRKSTLGLDHPDFFKSLLAIKTFE